MRPPNYKSFLAEYGFTALLTVGIFTLDLQTPSDVVVWALYALPLTLTLASSRPRAPLYFACLVTLLLGIGLVASPPGVSPINDMINRLLGIGLMWGFALVLVNRKQMTQALTDARAQQTQAELARADAEAAVVGAVAGQRRAEEQMREDKLRLEGIVQSAMDAIITVDEDQKIILFNQAAERMFQWSAGELLGRPLDRLIPERFRSAHGEHIRQFAQSGVTNRKMRALGTITGVRAGGEEFPIEASISQVGVEGKRYFTVILRDVTERKQAEASLRAVQGRFEDIFESSKDAIGYASLDGKFVLANQAFATLTGYSQEELLRMNYRALTPDEHRMAQAAVIARVLETGEPAEYEKEYIRKDGSRVPVALTVSMVKGEDGKPAGLAAIVRDITDRKQAEAAIRHSEQRYRRLVQVSPDAIFVMRGDHIVFSNGEGLNLLGATDDSQILGRSFLDFIRPDEYAAVRHSIYQITEGEEQAPLFEQSLVRLDGTTVVVEVTAARYTDQEGAAILVVARDITERKRLQAQLRRTERVAELGTVASGMAHEIGTPMNVILGRAEYLMERTKEEPVRKGLQTIVTQVERITRVMNQLLAFARRRPVEHRALDLRQTIEDNLEIFHERLTHNNITVETSFAEDCPLVHADADQMSQVLINLVMNAIHAMPQGGTLKLVLAPDRDMVKLTASDTGHGMPREVIAKVFDPFFTTKEFGKGTGLGLTVVKGIIEEHSGTIHVESEPGKGTVFTIGLPIHAEASLSPQ